MGYAKTTWGNGDIITAEKLNNIENGISNFSESSEIVYVNYTVDSNEEPIETDNRVILSVIPQFTIAQIFDWIDNGKYVVGIFKESASDSHRTYVPLCVRKGTTEDGGLEYCLYDTSDNTAYHLEHEKEKGTESATLKMISLTGSENEGNDESNDVFEVACTGTTYNTTNNNISDFSCNHTMSEIKAAIDENKAIHFTCDLTIDQRLIFSFFPKISFSKNHGNQISFSVQFSQGLLKIIFNENSCLAYFFTLVKNSTVEIKIAANGATESTAHAIIGTIQSNSELPVYMYDNFQEKRFLVVDYSNYPNYSITFLDWSGASVEAKTVTANSNEGFQIFSTE